MMCRFSSFLLLLLMMVFVSCEYISPHKISPNCNNFCGRIDCEPVKECEGGTIVEKGSYCGCCKACVKYIDTNQTCSKIVRGSLALIAQSRCKPGTECQNGKCVPVSDTIFECLHQKNIRERRKGTDLYKENIWIPQCDIEGKYVAKQKKIRKPVCFDESGRRIFGSADDGFENTCACSRYMMEKEKNDTVAYNTKPQEHCSSSGSFASLQCIGDLCYCADKNIGQVKSHVVPRNFLDKLPCYDKNSQTKNYLTNCETELQRSRKLSYDFHLKGMRVIGINRIKCDPDGTFSPTQCTTTKCICIDKEGVGIGSYHPDIKEIQDQRVNMVCNCAREEKYLHNSMFSCTKYGNYDPITCIGNHCVCVDDDGDIISEQPTKDLRNGTCDKLLENLAKNPDDSTDDNNDDSTDDYDYNTDDYSY